MKSSEENILSELQRLNSNLKKLSDKQEALKKEVNMIFADITGFENMVLKLVDQFQSSDEITKNINKYSH